LSVFESFSDKIFMYIDIIINTLKEIYPEALCALNYAEPWQLLVACRLSAQCTDIRVNKVTPKLFEKFPTAEALAKANVLEIEEIIKPCGLFKTKAASIKAAALRLVSVYGGVLPSSMEELLTLPGVGRKSANLLLGDIYGLPSYVVDTHCIRISGRLRLTENTLAERIEDDLRRVIPLDESGAFCHRIVLFGREYCKARTPECGVCPIRAALIAENPEFICNISPG
jgi:endonuclease-3